MLSARRNKRDLGVAEFPVLRAGNTVEADAYINEIYEWATRQVITTIEWYLNDKRIKRRLSQWLRALTIILAAAGLIQPLIGLASIRPYPSELGYIFLAAAGGCIAFDRFFGLSTTWMRDITAAQALKVLLDNFRIAWISLELAPQPQISNAKDSQISERISMIKDVITQSSAIIRDETGEWVEEFQSALSGLTGMLNNPNK